MKMEFDRPTARQGPASVGHLRTTHRRNGRGVLERGIYRALVDVLPSCAATSAGRGHDHGRR
jgi:hypothetical protein